MTQRSLTALALVAIALAAAAFNSLYIVAEGQSALLVRLGAPVAAIATPGLKFKWPVIDTATIYDARLISVNPPAEQIILGDQKRIEVQTYTRLRIVDPLRFYQSVHTVEQARVQLAQIVWSALRRELGKISLIDLLTPRRDAVLKTVETEVAERGAQLGVAIVEVRLHRADLPLETSQAIYDRMKSERQREAKELRAEGFEWAQQIAAKADADRTVLLSETQRDALVTRGEGDAEAARIQAEAAAQNPQFYHFYRTLQTYRQALAGSQPTVILSPDDSFLNLVKAGPGPEVSGGER